MSEELPTAVWSGTFRIWDIDLKCHVLSSGQRIIEKESFEAFMDALADGVPVADDADLMAFFRWQRGLG
jgi:hypothetical protein